MSAGEPHEQPVEGLGWMALGVIAFVVASWLFAMVVCLFGGGHLPRLGIFQATAAVLRLLAGGRWSDPASAYPADVQKLMPGPVVWWLIVALLLAGVGALGTFFALRLEPQLARERAGRRPYDWHGARPRAWGRGRDHIASRSRSRGFVLGRLDGRTVRADDDAHVLVVAPTRSGKTTRCVVPWLLEYDWPAIVTSTKRDVVDLTTEHRQRLGRVWIFDPFAEDSASWSPIRGCENWSYALRQAQWLADATTDGGSDVARYWRGEAAKLLAPLLHATALDHRGMEQILRWVDTQNAQQPTVTLAATGAEAARLQLQAVTDLDPRNRGTTYMSAGSVLAAYRYPEVLAHAGDEFTAEGFLLSRADTLFLVAAERHQQLLAPLMISLISSLMHHAIESGEFLTADKRLRVLLDEAANIAPLPELPRMLSQAAGHGIRIATIWQSLAQVRDRHGHGTDTVLANSQAKLFAGAITDAATREYLTDLLGADPQEPNERRKRLTPGELLQLEFGRGILVVGGRQPAVVALPGDTARRWR